MLEIVINASSYRENLKNQSNRSVYIAGENVCIGEDEVRQDKMKLSCRTDDYIYTQDNMRQSGRQYQ